MKYVTSCWKNMVGAGVAVAVVVLATAGFAQAQAEKVKPYPLKTCIVSGEKLDGDMGKPYVLTYEGREIKFCCKGCLKDFNKEPAKYIKKLEEAETAAKDGQKSDASAHDQHQH